MEHLDIAERAASLVEPILSPLGLELVNIEYKRVGRSAVLRVYIDREGGITLDDCADVSRELSVQLDVEDFITGRYTLEVSSPGLDRPLCKPSDFIRFTGKLAKIHTKQLFSDDMGNRRKTFLGHLVGVEGDSVRLKLVEGQSAVIPMELISKANLEYEF